MTENDRELLQKVLKNNMQLKRLYERHELLAHKVSRFEARKFLTSEEEMELKRLKKLKLSGKDKMMALLTHEHRV